jgi:hypothetical protein
MLGLPVQTSLGLERWLTETFQFVAAICYSPDLLIALGLALLVSGFWPAQALYATRSAPGWVNSRIVMPLLRRYHPQTAPRAVIVIGCALLIRHLQLLTQIGTSVIVGPIRAGGAIASARTQGDHLFVAMVAYCAAATWLYRNRTLPAAGSWKIAVAVTVLVALQTPIAHGMFTRSTSYSTVEVGRPASQPQCGALVLENSDRLYVWRSNGAIGSVDLVPKDKDISIRAVGQIDVLSGMSLAKGDVRCP